MICFIIGFIDISSCSNDIFFVFIIFVSLTLPFPSIYHSSAGCSHWLSCQPGRMWCWQTLSRTVTLTSSNRVATPSMLISLKTLTSAHLVREEMRGGMEEQAADMSFSVLQAGYFSDLIHSESLVACRTEKLNALAYQPPLPTPNPPQPLN